MAKSIYTDYTSDTCPRVKFTIDTTSSDGDSVTLSWTLKYVTKGYTMSASTKVEVKAQIAGDTVYDSDITVNGKSTYTIKTGTYTVNRTHSDVNHTFKVYIYWGSMKWSGTTLGTRSGSDTFKISAQTSYTVSFNANGGSGAPSSQTKWYGDSLTLSSTKPSRTGYTFSKWNTSSSGSGTSYSPGGSYTANASATLYAIWTANTYTITLNANGGTNGSVTSVKKTYNSNVTLPTAAQSPTRTNYTFLGWSSSSSSSSAQWTAGATYSNNITANTTLYAVWRLAYIAPTITGLTCFRSDSSGTVSDDGSYACVKFSWKVDTSVYSSNAAASVTIALNGTTKYTYTAGGTSGSVSQVISGLSAESSYTITAAVKDTYTSGTTTTKTATIGSATYTIDILKGGTGIGFGTTAVSNYLTTPWYMKTTSGLYLEGHSTKVGSVIGGTSSTTTSLSADTYTNVYSVSVPAGTWIAHGSASWTVTSAGKFGLSITNSSNTGQNTCRQYLYATASYVAQTVSRVWSLSATTTIYLCAQSYPSGSSITSASLYLARIA